MRGFPRMLVAVVCAFAVSVACGGDVKREPALVVGRASPEAPPPATAEPGPPEIDAPELAPDPGLRAASGTGPPGAIPFRGAVDVPDHLLFFLVIGSDARPGQDITRTRADSIHVAAVDPASRRGTVIGLPRDSYVTVPGYGRRKINSALALGGPDLLVATVRELTGFPISYYALTGFDGIVRIVDELGGLDVFVPQRMDDRMSGARFEKGWHHMNGRDVLAFTRNRHVQGGDFTRSENHGRVILHALEKMRATVADSSGIRSWVNILFRHSRLDMSPEDAVRLGNLARTLAPAELANVVAAGSPRSVGGQSVVVLSAEAFRLFRDVGADGVADGNETPREASRPPGGGESTPAPTAPAGTPPPSPQATPSPSPTATPSGILPVP